MKRTRKFSITELVPSFIHLYDETNCSNITTTIGKFTMFVEESVFFKKLDIFYTDQSGKKPHTVGEVDTVIKK